MKADGVSKLYDRLTVAELFRLRLAALARGDRADCDRLDRACRSLDYQAYRSRLEASDVLTLCALVDLLPKMAKLQMLQALRPVVEMLEGAATDAAWLGYLDGMAAGWRAAGKRCKPPAVADERLTAASERAYGRGSYLSEALGDASAALAASARTPRDALARFARDELGVTLDVLLGAWGGTARDTIVQHAEILDSSEPNEEEIALLRDVLGLAWRRHGLNDPDAEIGDDVRERYEAAMRGAQHGALDV